MNKIVLIRQTSHKYNAAWSYLNDSEEVGTARVMSRKLFRGNASHEETNSFILLKVQSKESVSNIMQGIRDTMRHACRCEHDCCGHMQTSISRIRPLQNGFYAVIECGYRNC